MQRLLAILSILLLISVGACKKPKKPPKAQLEWLTANTITLKTAVPNSGFEDLPPIKELIGDSRIVALGEVTHGTKETYQLNHRLIDYLMRDLGFNTLVLAANMPETMRLNDYVLTGKGDAKEILRTLTHWQFRSEEFLELIEIIRRFNQTGQGRVEIFGCDARYPMLAANNVREFISKAEPEYLSTLDLAYHLPRGYEALKRNSYHQLDIDILNQTVAAEDKLGFQQLSEQVWKHLQNNREKYLANNEPAQVDAAIQQAGIVVQSARFLQQLDLTTPEANNATDAAMAENIEWLLTQKPDRKLIIWAHNEHIARKGRVPSIETLGARLAQKHSKEMLVCGATFAKGQYLAWPARKDRPIDEYLASEPIINAALTANPGSFEWLFLNAKIPIGLLDLRKASKDANAAEWINKTYLLRSIGSSVDSTQFFDNNVTERFDVMIYQEKTKAATLFN